MKIAKDNTNSNTKKWKKSLLKILWILYAIFSIVVWLPKFDSMLTSKLDEAAQCDNLNNSWNIQIEDQEYTDVSLDELKFPAVNKGDQLVLERMLPVKLLYEDGVLRMNLEHSALRIFIEDEMVYEYGFDRTALNKSVGSGIVFIDFPGNYAGKKNQNGIAGG